MAKLVTIDLEEIFGGRECAELESLLVERDKLRKLLELYRGIEPMTQEDLEAHLLSSPKVRERVEQLDEAITKVLFELQRFHLEHGNALWTPVCRALLDGLSHEDRSSVQVNLQMIPREAKIAYAINALRTREALEPLL